MESNDLPLYFYKIRRQILQNSNVSHIVNVTYDEHTLKKNNISFNPNASHNQDYGLPQSLDSPFAPHKLNSSRETDSKERDYGIVQYRTLEPIKHSPDLSQEFYAIPPDLAEAHSVEISTPKPAFAYPIKIPGKSFFKTLNNETPMANFARTLMATRSTMTILDSGVDLFALYNDTEDYKGRPVPDELNDITTPGDDLYECMQELTYCLEIHEEDPICAVSKNDKLKKFRSICEFEYYNCKDGQNSWRVINDGVECVVDASDREEAEE